MSLFSAFWTLSNRPSAALRLDLSVDWSEIYSPINRLRQANSLSVNSSLCTKVVIDSSSYKHATPFQGFMYWYELNKVGWYRLCDNMPHSIVMKFQCCIASINNTRPPPYRRVLKFLSLKFLQDVVAAFGPPFLLAMWHPLPAMFRPFTVKGRLVASVASGAGRVLIKQTTLKSPLI